MRTPRAGPAFRAGSSNSRTTTVTRTPRLTPPSPCGIHTETTHGHFFVPGKVAIQLDAHTRGKHRRNKPDPLPILNESHRVSTYLRTTKTPPLCMFGRTAGTTTTTTTTTTPRTLSIARLGGRVEKQVSNSKHPFAMAISVALARLRQIKLASAQKGLVPPLPNFQNLFRFVVFLSLYLYRKVTRKSPPFGNSPVCVCPSLT